MDGVMQFFHKTRGKRSKRNAFGRTTGVVWEWAGYDGVGDRSACIVQIEREANLARITIFDSNDIRGSSAMNVFEAIASGVYLEHLAKDYSPNQIEFIHRDTLPFDSASQWGTMPVTLTWNPGRCCFENPQWGTWKSDFEVPENELDFIQNLHGIAAVAVEQFMRERHEAGRVTPREEELYNAFQEKISMKAEKHRYNLRGGWLFAKPSLS